MKDVIIAQEPVAAGIQKLLEEKKNDGFYEDTFLIVVISGDTSDVLKIDVTGLSQEQLMIIMRVRYHVHLKSKLLVELIHWVEGILMS